MNNVICYDIETPKGCFLISFYDPEKDNYYDFFINKYRNDIYRLQNFVSTLGKHYWVGYNNISFDAQVMEYIFRNCDRWNLLDNLEISAKIWQKAQDIIHDSSYDVFPEYKEVDFSFKQIDLFKINHYDTHNRLVSLKRLMFEMSMENIEEFPIHHEKVNFTIEEINSLRNYCHNDLKATYEFYKITIGDTDHPLYRENNQIQLRRDIQEEFGINCLNYSDTKIGDEIIKKFYCEEKRIDYKELPKKGTFRKSINVKDCIASYIKFQTPELRQFLYRIKQLSFTQKDEFKESIVFRGNIYSFMRGGLHTEQQPKIFEASENQLIVDWDVMSYYPAIIINNRRYPAHLGKEFLRGYEKLFNRRLELKPLAKSDKRIAGIVAALKLCVNGVYGKSSDMQNWMYDRLLTMFTTITGELSLMMLIEALELNGCHTISCNTDGITVMIDRDKEQTMIDVCNWWMSVTKFELERADYKKIVFSSVNDYLAIKTNGEVKKKGQYIIDTELYKNRSNRIVPIALNEWFVRSVLPNDTIRSHTNIYDFCIRQKASKDFHYEGVKDDGSVSVYNKLIRYYVSSSGEKLYKIKNPTCTTNAPERSQIEAGKWKCTVCNYLPKETKVEDCDVNYEYYITKTEDIIVKIDKTYKRTQFVMINKQLSLW